ncbi:hypothetical protein NXC24_PB00396 (plasmid) [Rhizobium sp. NXC24]|nr:hypothetical protein NXC24_PB00396 [Rhizobium sp. NXC24]
MRWGSVGGYSFLIQSTKRKADWSGKFHAVSAATLRTVAALQQASPVRQEYSRRRY